MDRAIPCNPLGCLGLSHGLPVQPVGPTEHKPWLANAIIIYQHPEGACSVDQRLVHHCIQQLRRFWITTLEGLAPLVCVCVFVLPTHPVQGHKVPGN